MSEKLKHINIDFDIKINGVLQKQKKSIEFYINKIPETLEELIKIIYKTYKLHDFKIEDCFVDGFKEQDD
jgi:hypothetical protein